MHLIAATAIAFFAGSIVGAPFIVVWSVRSMEWLDRREAKRPLTHAQQVRKHEGERAADFQIHKRQ
jgi:hypothetical protein